MLSVGSCSLLQHLVAAFEGESGGCTGRLLTVVEWSLQEGEHGA